MLFSLISSLIAIYKILDFLFARKREDGAAGALHTVSNTQTYKGSYITVIQHYTFICFLPLFIPLLYEAFLISSTRLSLLLNQALPDMS